MKQKFSEWGISGHHGLDFALPEATEVLAVDQAVNSGNVIGLSGQSGAAYGVHLHFGLKLNNPDPNNGYLGFIDPSPYLPPISFTPRSPTESGEVGPTEPQPSEPPQFVQ